MFFQRSKPIRTLGLLFACLALFGVAGGHWTILQTVAWVRMIHDYSQESTLGAAVAKTFSGESPCELCERVKKGRQQEEKSPATVKVDKKAEVFPFPDTDLLPKPPFHRFAYPSPVCLDPAFHMKTPPGPPPKSFPA